MSCSSLTSCQHGHVRTLSSTDEHVFARLGWIHDPVCSVALPTAVIPFTFRACPRSAVCCRIKPYHFCIQPGPRPRSPPSSLAPRTPAPLPGPRLPWRSPLKARCPGPRPAAPGRVLRAPPAAAARDSRLGGNRDTTVEFETADSSVPARRRGARAPVCGYTPGATARSCVKARRPKASYLNEATETVPPAAAFGSGRGAALVVVPGARVRPRDWSRARAILTTDNALARLSHSSDSTRKRPREALSL